MPNSWSCSRSWPPSSTCWANRSRTAANSQQAAAALRELAPRLDPDEFVPHAPVTESVFVLLCRPLVVDLLMATGYSIDDARALLPAL